VIPVLARTRTGLAAARRGLGCPVVLVPTMGALHEGHRALLRHGQDLCGPNGSVVVSVFVNPFQFGAGEDFDTYPRTLQEDVAVCAEEGVDLVFAPGRGEMYPGEQRITVDPGPMGQALEGASRPGFFTGVLTVVLKLFQLVRPDVAVFGEKDAQQLALVRWMAEDFALGIEVAGVPTVRDPDGLAISSRNRYLSPVERHAALALSAALRAGRGAASAGPAGVLKAAHQVLDAVPALLLDYLALVDPATFEQVAEEATGAALLLVAARVGTTRLIDNTPLTLSAVKPVERHAVDD